MKPKTRKVLRLLRIDFHKTMRVLLLSIGTLAALSFPANADSCSFLEHAEAKSKDGRYVVKLDWEDGWKGRFEDTNTGKAASASIKGLERHAHFRAFVTDDGSRVVLFESSLDHGDAPNLLVFDRNLTQLKGFTLKDLLTRNDFNAIRRSVSHIQMLSYTHGLNPTAGLKDDGTKFFIYLKSKRTVLVSLAEPRIIPTPDVEPEVFEFEEGLPPGKNDLERMQGKWMPTESREGILVVDPDILREAPWYYYIEGDVLNVPGTVIGKRIIKLDESVTPHAIDLTQTNKPGVVRGIYEFKGGKLRLCFNLDENLPRPTTLDGEGFKVVYSTITLQRRKEKK